MLSLIIISNDELKNSGMSGLPALVYYALLVQLVQAVQVMGDAALR